MTGGLPTRAKVPATESQGPQASGGSRGSHPWASTDVLVVGAGPAGLAAAVELRRLGTGRVVVADRDDEAGGIPRHSAHTGFGARDLRRVLTGPGYARRYADAAAAAGADIRLGTTVTGWEGWDGTPGGGLPGDGQYSVTLTSPAGIETVGAGAAPLATGCRERPRAARLVPGDRQPGVITTGELQRRCTWRGSGCPGGAGRRRGARQLLRHGHPGQGARDSRPDRSAADRRAIWRVVWSAAKRVGLKLGVSPHWLRHSHGSHALNRGAPIHVVQQKLGHASLATTSVYLHKRAGDHSANYLPTV